MHKQLIESSKLFLTFIGLCLKMFVDMACEKPLYATGCDKGRFKL